MTTEKRQFLSTLLEVALQKMKWDSETDADDLDEDDRMEFDQMRKVDSSSKPKPRTVLNLPLGPQDVYRIDPEHR